VSFWGCSKFFVAEGEGEARRRNVLGLEDGVLNGD